jgi:hypothetical protein
MPRIRWDWIGRLSALTSTMAVSGCLARFERNLDLAFATEAAENLLRLPLSSLLATARLFSVFP